ncbi:glycosyltransferase [Calothrix sp. PCC 7507]|uniref:glycosyltransferase n=1 Tax=Calothrix sp. PCC 7507 TaxID=99598 RepID=UPI00029ED4F1|nr:glycosyltransferase [Calothrix sp. PCC 7507]AFY30945.1 glycosyl transferase family 2 [Calothrix sp. PCC 7507]
MRHNEHRKFYFTGWFQLYKRKVSKSNLSYKTLKTPLAKGVFQFRATTLILLISVILLTIVVVGWFAGEATISGIFTQINHWQVNSPKWLNVPSISREYLLAPSLGLLFTVFIVMKISPQPRIWSQRFVVGILIILTSRYMMWRSLSTLNVENPLTGVFSLGLFCLEMLMLFKSSISLFLMLNVKDRHREANTKSLAVIDGSFLPSIDILIPTYDEKSFILRRTIIGCQALEYANKKIYILDDTRRSEIKDLAEELGCEYVTRPDNFYAKAGNLNHAIAQTNGELIVVFDADFIPTKNFLTRTVGFFQNEKVALVQTPQSFYNADPIARNLGLENILTPDEEVFYRQIQPLRDAAGSVVCAGTSFIVRRTALAEIGGFVTESLSEDYFTGICLSAQGYQIIYLNEKLSAGLASENISTYVVQRLRWSQGTLQAFFIKSNPLTIPGLNFVQRLANLEGLLHHALTSISQIYFMLMPLVYAFLGVIPIRATLREVVYFLLPFYLVNLAVYSWLNYRSRSSLLSDIYSLFLCLPLALTVIQVMLNPFAKGFKVTPKGILSDRYNFNWNLALPLVLLFIATAVSLLQNLCMCIVKVSWANIAPLEIAQQTTGISLGWLWSAYNLIMISVTLLILIDAPKLDIYEWFNLRRVVQLKVGEQTFWGITTMISEVGAEVALTQKPQIYLSESQSVDIKITEEKLQLSGEIIHTRFDNEFPKVRIKFTSVSLSQHRRLVEMLFCRPGQWKIQNVPGELSALFLLFRTLMKPRILFNRKVDITPIKVSQV